MGNGWFWCSITGALAATPLTIAIGPPAPADNAIYNSVTDYIYIWGAQAEIGPLATAYIPTTSAAAYAPRFDYDPASLAPRGLLLEQQRTNQLLYSGDLTNAAWVVYADGTGTASRTAIAGTAPDGSSTAILMSIDRSTTNAWAQIHGSFTSSGANACTGSLWLKAYTLADVGKVIDLMINAAGQNVALTLCHLNGRLEAGRTSADNTGVATVELNVGYGHAGVLTYAGVNTPSLGTGPIQFLAWVGKLSFLFLPADSVVHSDDYGPGNPRR